MIRDEATLNQLRAADPAASTWLAANAGSGKTRVLTDRVARLLLRGTDPQNILCLTYTKAAAAEMQNRLFKRLGEWAMLPDDALRAALVELGEDPPSGPEGLAQARILFAQAMEVPGGLRIQTIHAFCASLLRRFPLEAGVNPQFSEMEDRAAAMLRADIADRMAEGEHRRITDAFLSFASGDDIDPILAEITSKSELFAQRFDEDELRQALEIPSDASMAKLVASLMGEGEMDLIRKVTDLCLKGSSNDQKAGDKLRGVTGQGRDIAILENVFLTGEGAKEPFTAKIGKFPTKATREKAPDLMEDLDDLMSRVQEARPLRHALRTIDRSRALYDFAKVFIAEYEAVKSARGQLDFDDLIRRAQMLLTSRDVAQWVLFKLDGGIDHILVDEAQDTSPRQWAVIRGLASEFAAGHGARDIERTIFVVGDRKQSIYSFQGADPDQFDAMREHFEAELAQIDRTMARGSLTHSFRSAPAVLRAVDEVFQGEHLEGLGPEPSQHRAFKTAMPGRVDLWAPVPKAEKEDEGEEDWTAPVDRIGPRHHARILAEQLAQRIREMVDHETLPVEIGRTGTYGRRPIHEGDILILVQRRSDLFASIIRELKIRGLKVAGADRLRVGAELAVKDIGALLKFLSLAEDNLSLAEALRSPLFGWTEQELFTLAARRPGQSLWEELRRSGRKDTLDILDDLRTWADFLRPYDLINRLLVRHDGRRRLLARLGPEAEDGIDALLSQALSYEQGSVPSLTGFVEWMQMDETDLKRQMESRGDAIRVMTVHGSKGLEAPIVFLPDTAKRQIRDRDLVLGLNGQPIWPNPSAEATELQQALRAEQRAADERERRRLLYVAMTRAESWLIVAAAGETGTGGESWHAMVEEGLNRAGAVTHNHPGGPGLRLECGDWEGAFIAPPAPEAAPEVDLPENLPLLDHQPLPAPSSLSPSDLGGAKIMGGEADPDALEASLARGRLFHLLLERLVPLPAHEREAEGFAMIAAIADPELVPDADALLFDVLELIDSPAMAEIFAPDALNEVTITAALPDGRRITGIIDRLIVTPEKVLAVDYKTNRDRPDTPALTPEGILRQMGAYAFALEGVYPGRSIETAILWTVDGTLMHLPASITSAALARATAP